MVFWKKYLGGLLAVLILFGCANQQQQNVPMYDTVTVVDQLVIDDNSVPIFPKKAALTTDTARRFSIELPKRCEVDWDNQKVVSVVPQEKIEIVRLNVGDALPELKVDDYEFKDLAQNAAEAYEADEFTVDTTAPEDLTVSYSTSVFNEILESVTFGYYNAQMTVTITADDETAGVYYFVYSYLKSEGVSDVNAELIDELIQDANENIKHDGKTSTASFTIPKLLLKNDNQFNGTVEFTAYDKAENNTEMIDDERITDYINSIKSNE